MPDAPPIADLPVAPDEGDGLAGLPELKLDELRAGGYLQEANRWFFHPLGLALAVINDGETQRLTVIDAREDLEGVWFAPLDDQMVEMASKVRGEWEGRNTIREPRLGFIIQPVLPDEIEEHQSS